ncbi:hypothetical protein RBY4I_4124 [Rhodobacterales bacterium Y4I]|nr:hypothetical protein RBY4I_4124 [Rhodobacterales bacterium Y4I]
MQKQRGMRFVITGIPPASFLNRRFPVTQTVQSCYIRI